MPTLSRTSTTDMEVTSIRLEKDLKESLKAIAGNRGYQALIRDILWAYVEQQSGTASVTVDRHDIRATIAATAERAERCVMTGQAIAPGEAMLLGLTPQGALVPLCAAAATQLP
ncbi:MAG TPA: ribbon-helix-helix domain-containing protein [Candidatus Obscuribacterales bacterium]